MSCELLLNYYSRFSAFTRNTNGLVVYYFVMLKFMIELKGSEKWV